MKILKKLKQNSAMTLIETVLYLGLFAIIFTTVVQFTLSLNEYQNRSKIRADLVRSTIFLSQHLGNSFENASSLDDANTNFDIDNGRLRLTTPDNSTLEYTITDGQLFYITNSQNTVLTNTNFIITKFQLNEVTSQTNQTLGVKVTITLVNTNNSSINKTFSTMYKLK